MRCGEVGELLVAYLDGELTPSERTLAETHLAECRTCQEDLAELSALRRRVGHSLRIRAAQSGPSTQAWSHLQARLAGEARPLPRWLPAKAERLASGIRRFAGSIGEGGATMKLKRFALSGVVVVVLVAGVFALTNVGSGNSTVFAKGIAQKSYQLVSSLPPQRQQAIKQTFGADARTILQEAQNASDLKVLTYDELVSQSPNAVPPGDAIDLRNLTFLQFTENGAKVVVGIDQNNVPVFMATSNQWRVTAHPDNGTGADQK